MTKLLVALAVVAVACGGSDSVSLDDYPVEFREAFCRNFVKCGVVKDLETCRNLNFGIDVHITASGQALGVDSVSLWLTHLEQIDGWVNPWASSVTAGGEGTSVFTFATTVDLTPAVETRRGSGAADAG